MRPAILICFFAVSGYAANAQFSLLPQLGLERSKTAIAFNKQAFAAPLGCRWSPQAAVRLEYTFKKSHGPFVEVATSRSIVKYDFSDAQTAASDYTATRGKMQLRLEGGYQVATKPIYFKKAPTRAATSQFQKSSPRSGCHSYTMQSGGCSRMHKATTAQKPRDTRTWMRLQPAVGVAYIPGTPTNTIYEAAPAVYQYNAGNWTTAFSSGMGFEFGKGTQPKFQISLNYLKGLSNLGTQSITTLIDNKPVTTNLKSSTASWNIRMGIPIRFEKKQPVVKQQTSEKTYNAERRCGQYKMQYHHRCGGY